MTGLELYEQLKILSTQGTKHRHLITKGKAAGHNGYDESEDSSMVIFFFADGIVVVAPYNQVSFYKIDFKEN